MALIAAAAYGLALFGIGLWFIRKHRIEDECGQNQDAKSHRTQPEQDARPERREVAMSSVK